MSTAIQQERVNARNYTTCSTTCNLFW